MTKEATETCIGKRTAHAMRAAAIRFAQDRAEHDADPSEAYGCVDWFQYGVTSPPQEEDIALPPAAARPYAGRGGAPSGH
jgi:hypothetical protein